MPKKLAVLVVFFIIAFILTPAVLAQTSSPSAARQKISDLKEQRKEAIAEIREKARTAIETKREAFKERLEIVKDERKKIILQRIDAKLSEINIKHTDLLSKALERIQNFLDKLSASATDSSILADIEAAQTAIDTAQTSLEEQAGKTYSISIISETTVRQNAGTTIAQLRKDINASRELVQDAKQAVIDIKTERNTLRPTNATGSADL